MQQRLRLILAGLSLALIGCGTNRTTGRLSGSIVFDGVPMDGGKVLATLDGLQIVDTDIIAGKYLFPACPQGEVRLAVFPPAFGRIVSMPPMADKEPIASLRDKRLKIKASGGIPLTEKQKELQRRYKDFPDDYRDFERSSLRVTVTAGDNPFNIDLKSSQGEK